MGFISLLLLIQPFVQTPSLDNAYISFKLNHMGVLTVEGKFEQIAGEFERTRNGWELRGEIDVKNIDTGNSSRDETVLTEQYLNSDEYPIIPFIATIDTSQDLPIISVEATVRGLSFGFETQLENSEGMLVSKPVVIDRQAIGLDFGAMDTLIGDEITIVIHSGLKSEDL